MLSTSVVSVSMMIASSLVYAQPNGGAAKPAGVPAAAQPANAGKAAPAMPKPMPEPLAPAMPPPPGATPALPTASTTQCFQLEGQKGKQTKDPQLLCVQGAGNDYTITLSYGVANTTFATFTLQLKGRARCIDCNKDEFALANPANSVFNKLAIRFNGKRTLGATMTETGTVMIGNTSFFYRSVGTSPGGSAPTQPGNAGTPHGMTTPKAK